KEPWVHWVLYNVPATKHDLEEGVPAVGTLPDGSMQGTNDFGKMGYGGPDPPPGAPHRYFFKIYALKVRLDLPEGATKQQVEEALQGHILAQGQLMGKYGR